LHIGDISLLIVNPKRVNETIEVKPCWYSYYAGYSHTFTQKIIESSGISKQAIILDPWNGAGTTTLMSSINGYRSKGVDLNPVMRVIATAKQATKSDVEFVKHKLDQVSAKVRVFKEENDPLHVWFDTGSVQYIRKIENCILAGKLYATTTEKVLSLTAGQCLMYTALFNCIRANLTNFVPSNPTWIKKPKSESDKVDMSWATFKGNYISHVKEMIDSISIVEHEWSPTLSQITVGSSTELDIKNSSVDLVLTSPPYCTRIDYGVATLPELSVLCVEGVDEIASIRRKLMGTTTVPKNIDERISNLTGECSDFLAAVKSHASKASETYYYKNLFQYFSDLNKSISEIARVLKVDSKFICVVQDSYYKDIHCDLPKIMIEIAEFWGLNLLDNIQFESKRNMANLNVKIKQYRKNSLAYENVLIFKKG
jgi:DNA modification methylase